MFWAAKWECTMGLTLIVAGLIFYAIFARGERRKLLAPAEYAQIHLEKS
jgi:hypothetical protein